MGTLLGFRVLKTKSQPDGAAALIVHVSIALLRGSFVTWIAHQIPPESAVYIVILTLLR